VLLLLQKPTIPYAVPPVSDASVSVKSANASVGSAGGFVGNVEAVYNIENHSKDEEFCSIAI